MRLVLAGTPEFAAQPFQALIDAGHEIGLVLTQPDRPAGRGQRLQAPAVKLLAQRHGLPLAQPRSLRLDGKFADDARAAVQALQAADADAMVVAAYGLLLPPWVLELPRLGCINIHASLLPRWRGAAPIHRAIEAGDDETGITIMQMDAGLDTGDMLLVERLPIAPDDTTATLHDKLAALGARAIVAALARTDLQRTPQPDSGVTYARKVDKSEASIDWMLPAALIERRVRAFDPFPGASFMLNGEPIKLWRAGVAERPAGAAPGQVLVARDGHLRVACGEDALELRLLQWPGGRRIDTAAFLSARPLVAGDRIG